MRTAPGRSEGRPSTELRRRDGYGGGGANETDPDDREIGLLQRCPERRLARTRLNVERLDVEIRADGRANQGDGTFPLPGLRQALNTGTDTSV